jgi:hypothetical protein
MAAFFRGRDFSFTPHDFDPRMVNIETNSPIETPEIIIMPAALEKMWHYVNIADKEVGWLGTATRFGKNFLIEDVYLLRQRVHSTTTIITPEGMGEFAMELLENNPDADKIINNIRFWGHSHVYMDTSPSGQDEFQMECFRKMNGPFMIRGIFNKKGKISFTIFDWERKIKTLDAKFGREVGGRLQAQCRSRARDREGVRRKGHRGKLVVRPLRHSRDPEAPALRRRHGSRAGAGSSEDRQARIREAGRCQDW